MKVNNKQQQKQRDMKKLMTFLLAVLLSGKLLMAQTIDDAKRSLYYGRTTSAKQILDKAVAANPKDAQAIYWLGQTYLEMDSIGGARQVYQNALNAGVNDPWVWVGMGHVELLQGKKDAARQRFEAAITASQKKKKDDVNILNAIGRANADGPANVGDPAYAVQILKRAVALDPNNADVNTNLGINYLKLGSDQGGNAYEAYNNAIKADPKNAKAKFRLGKIFESQGNTEKFLQYYNDAVTADPAYAPGYLQLYNYYADRDVNKAKVYLEKYIANSDKDCSTDAAYADYLFRSGKYQESLAKAKAMESGACKNFPGLKVIYAYNYDRLGDSMQARSNIESYLSTVSPEKVNPSIYQFAGNVLLKFPGQDSVATTYLEKAMSTDTVAANKLNYINTIIESLGKAGNYAAQVKWYKKLAAMKPELTSRDLYFYSDAAIKANDFTTADSVSKLYVQKFPDQPQGYAALAKTAIAQDKDTTTGSAVPAVMNYIQWMEKTDKEKYKNTIVTNYGYLVAVHANTLKDYPAALKDLEGILAIDPSNTYAQSTAETIKRAMNPPKQSAGKTTSRKTATKKKG
jgi:tetratricopeptide (TPR) repeat protein